VVDDQEWWRERDEAVANSGILRRTIDPELASIVAFAAAANRTFFAGLSILTGRRQFLLSSIGTDVVETPADQSFCQYTIQRPGEPLIVLDAAADPRFSSLSVVTNDPHIRFYAGVSVVDRNGYPLGALCIGNREAFTGIFDPTDLLIRAHEIERWLRR
jgi:GAF domain-containing protein